MEWVLLSGRWAVHQPSWTWMDPRLYTAWCFDTPSQGFVLSTDILHSRHLRHLEGGGPIYFQFLKPVLPKQHSFSPWATNRDSWISWVWYCTVAWSFPNKGNNLPEYVFKWNYIGCNLRCLNNFLCSTSEMMDTTDPVSISMLTCLPSNNNWTWNPHPPCPLDLRVYNPSPGCSSVLLMGEP